MSICKKRHEELLMQNNVLSFKNAMLSLKMTPFYICVLSFKNAMLSLKMTPFYICNIRSC